MQYYALILNRTYRVYITKRMLCGGKVAGLVASPRRSTDAMQNPNYWSRSRIDHAYERMDKSSKDFLEYDRANFQIKWPEIERVTFDPSDKWGMGNVPHSGKLLIHLKAGDARELVLLGRQDGEHLKAQIEKAMAKA